MEGLPKHVLIRIAQLAHLMYVDILKSRKLPCAWRCGVRHDPRDCNKENGDRCCQCKRWELAKRDAELWMQLTERHLIE
jgi:hypothetical protein